MRLSVVEMGLSFLVPRLFDHVDLRVRKLATVEAFYCALLPALGFGLHVEIEGWLQFEAPGDGATEFFGIAEDPAHQPNATRIAFWVESNARVDDMAKLVCALGARNVEGPGFESEAYYAVFFDDPSGNRLEICHRARTFND